MSEEYVAELEARVKHLEAVEEKLIHREKELVQTKEELELVKVELEHQIGCLNQAAIVSITDEAGDIIYVNDLFCKISQYSRDELVGKNHRVLKSNVQPQGLFVGMWKALTQGLSWHGEICNLAKDGSFYWVDTTIVPIRNEQGKIERYVSVRFDITKQVEQKTKLESQALELAEAKFQMGQQIDTLNEAAIVSETDANGNILFVNQKFCDISGYKKEELIGKNHRILKSGIHPDGLFIGMWKAISMGRSWNGEICNLAKDGSHYWVDTTIVPFKDNVGRIERYVSVRFDITKQVEQRLELANLNDRLEERVSDRTKELEDAKNVLSETFECITDAFVSLDKNWNYTYMNKKAGEIFDREPAKMIGKNIWTEFPEGVGKPFHTAYHRALKNQEYIYLEEYYEPYDLWFENHIYPSKDGISIYFRDVSERKKMEIILRNEKEKSDRLIATVPGVVGSMKLAPDGTLSMPYTSPSSMDVYGLSPEQLDSDAQIMLSEIPLEDRIVMGETLAESAKTLTPWRCQHRYNHPSKGEVWLEGHSMPVAEPDGSFIWHGFVEDITARKEANEKLQLNEEKYRTLFDYSPDGIIIGGKDGNLKDVNPKILELLSYDVDELIGKPIPFMVYEDKEGEAESDYKDVLAGLPYSRNWRFRRKDNSSFEGEVISVVMPDGNVLGLIRDITERREAEKKILQQNEELRNLSSHLQTVREEERLHISREIHDELGQYLTAIKMDVSWLKNRNENREKEEDRKLDQLLSIVNDSVGTVRRISSELRPAILDDLGLVAALEWQSGEVKKRKGIECVFRSNVEDVDIRKDTAIGIYRLFQEALTNIYRHSEANKVTVTLRLETESLSFEVSDNGKGFDQKKASKQKSFGLVGMRERAAMMNGTLEIESGKSGTTIRLKVPKQIEA